MFHDFTMSDGNFFNWNGATDDVGGTLYGVDVNSAIQFIGTCSYFGGYNGIGGALHPGKLTIDAGSVEIGGTATFNMNMWGVTSGKCDQIVMSNSGGSGHVCNFKIDNGTGDNPKLVVTNKDANLVDGTWTFFTWDGTLTNDWAAGNITKPTGTVYHSDATHMWLSKP